MRHTLRVATRQSKLALWQAEHVAAKLRAAHPTLTIELVPMTTQGDQVLDRSLAAVGGKGLFVKELELALQEQRADLAVHSMKDVPTVLPAGMCLSAVLSRADARDAFVATRFTRLIDLPQGARVGTSSVRRQCQLLTLRPDLKIFPLRGNVETRLRKLDADEFDAIILASAGLQRLGLGHRITELLDIEYSMPAVGQGVIGIECRSEDILTNTLTAVLNDADTDCCLQAERGFAARLEGDCRSPIAALAQLAGPTLQLRGLVAAIDGSQVVQDFIEGSRYAPAALGVRLAERLLAAGAEALLAAHRSMP